MPAPAHRSRLLAGIALLAIASTLAVAAAPAQALLGGRLLKRLAERRNAGTTTLPAPAGMQTQRDIAYGPDPKQRMGDHPIVWTRCIGQGRVFYSALGHKAATYAEPLHLQMIDGALGWAAEARSRGCD